MQNRMIDDVANLLNPGHEKELEEGIKAILVEEKVSEDKHADIIKGAKKSLNIILINKAKIDLDVMLASLEYLENPIKATGLAEKDMDRIKNRISNLEAGDKILAEFAKTIHEASFEMLDLAIVLLAAYAQSPELAFAIINDVDLAKAGVKKKVENQKTPASSRAKEEKESKETPASPSAEQRRIQSPSASQLSLSMRSVIGVPASATPAAVVVAESEQDKSVEKPASLSR